MKKSTLNRLIVLAVAVCVLVGVSPLLKTITGLADVNANFIARINGNEQQSGDTFDEVITKSTVTNITSITMIAGEVSQTEFQYLIDNGLHTNLADLTTNTPPFTIDPTIFADFPAERKLHVPAAYLEQYKIVDDGDTTDNFWYGWSIMEATPPALVPASSVQEIQNPLGINMVAPAEGGTPTTTLDVGTGYTSVITWKNGETPHTDVFAPNTIYSAEVTLTSVEKFKFVPNASVSVDTGTVASMPVVTGEGSGNTLSFVVTFPNTTASNLAPPPTNDGILPPATEPPATEPPTPEAPTPENPTPDVTSSDVTSSDVSTPDVSTPDNSSSDTSSVWKPTTMGGFRDTPRASTGGIPMPMAATGPLTATIDGSATTNNITRTYPDVEIGGILKLVANYSNPQTNDETAYSAFTTIAAGDPLYDLDNPNRKKRTATVTDISSVYKYEWRATRPSTAEDSLAGANLNTSELVLSAYTAKHLGTHTYTVKITETTTTTVKENTEIFETDETTSVRTILDATAGTVTIADRVAENSVVIEVKKILPTLTLDCVQVNNSTARMTATITGVKNPYAIGDTSYNPTNLSNFGSVKFTRTGAGSTYQSQIYAATTTATSIVFMSEWNPLLEQAYPITAEYQSDTNYDFSNTNGTTYFHNLNPTKIHTQDIGVITIDPPIAGKDITKNDSIKKPANASPGYAIDLKWYLGDSLVTEKFYYGQSHKAIVTITSLDGVAGTDSTIQSFTLAPNTIASFIALGATIYPTTPMPAYPNLPSVIGGNDRGVGNYIQYTIIFPRTLTEEVKSQETFAFNPFAVPTSKVYGDTDFILQAYGGEGSGSVTYTSDQPNVLRVTTDPYGRAVIKVMGSGTAIITATKAASFVGNDGVWYGLAEAKTTPIVVAPKMLTASVDDKTIKVGSRTTAFNVRVRGFVNGDTADNLVGYAPPIASADVEDVPILGTYDIIVSGGKADPKYIFKYVHGLLTVNETGIAPTTNNTSNTVVAGGNSAYIHEPRNDVTITRKDAQYFETGVNMSVEKQTSTISVAESDVVNRNVNAALPGKSTADIYNVSLSLDNEGYALNTEVSTQLKITTTIKNNYTDLGVVHIDAAGNIRSIPSSITSNGEYITFSTNYVGKFAIVGKLRVASADTGGTTTPPPTTTYNPQTGDSTPTFPFIAAILLGCTLLITGSRKGDLI